MLRDLTEYRQERSAEFARDRACRRDLLTELLNLRACHFDLQPSDPPMARIEATATWFTWGCSGPPRRWAFPGRKAEIVAQWRGRVLGRFVMTPTPGEPVALERRVVAALVASVVGATLASETRVS